jgi:hypothetical protein
MYINPDIYLSTLPLGPKFLVMVKFPCFGMQNREESLILIQYSVIWELHLIYSCHGF